MPTTVSIVQLAESKSGGSAFCGLTPGLQWVLNVWGDWVSEAHTRAIPRESHFPDSAFQGLGDPAVSFKREQGDPTDSA